MPLPTQQAMRAARLAILVFVLLATLVSSAPAKQPPPLAAPNGLRGFLLRPNEAVTHTFPRTPAFAWNPVHAAACYEFELATSRSFQDGTIAWSNVPTTARAGKFCGPVKFTMFSAKIGEDAEKTEQKSVALAPIRIPALSLNLTLPWFTGKPYALYARVRAITTRGPTAWSRSFGFDMRWEDLPVPMQGRPGLVRWAPVEGATAYEVWFPDSLPGFPTGKLIRTHTNVADEREFYIFHLDDGWWSTIRWRVRAVRQVLGALPNGLPAVSYGPWTPYYATTNPGWSAGPMQVKVAISDAVSAAGDASVHQLMPALTFTGDQGLDGRSYRLFRFYAATDRDCVNVVFKGSVIGGPAFAPRTSGPLKLPLDDVDLDFAIAGILPSWLDENAKTFGVDTVEFKATETMKQDEPARVDLPDLDFRTTRYYWTVVPVAIYVNDKGQFEYHDLEAPQDACEQGRVASFGKVAEPVITSSGSPFVSGLTPSGRLLSSAGRRPVVYSTPLVAWKPLVGATGYEVQWSKSKYPWRPRGKLTTFSTSALLKLSPGLWYYRVRGLDSAQVGVSAMTWSDEVAVRVARPTFRISH
jgi:hypothetical protein